MFEKSHQHVHINVFGRGGSDSFKEDAPAFTELMKRFGFRINPCMYIEDEGWQKRLWITTKKTHSKTEARHIFALASAILKAHPNTRGYVERETVRRGAVARMKPRPYYSPTGLPLMRPQFEKTQRGADIHVFKPLDRSRQWDELDSELLRVGFYEVVRGDEKIWTLLLENAKDAELLFADLKKHFELSGGPSRIEWEKVEALMPAPGFKDGLLPVAKAGFYRTVKRRRDWERAKKRLGL